LGRLVRRNRVLHNASRYCSHITDVPPIPFGGLAQPNPVTPLGPKRVNPYPETGEPMNDTETTEATEPETGQTTNESTPPQADQTQEPEPQPEKGRDNQGDEAAKWKALARKNETLAKRNKEALDKALAEQQAILDNIAQALGLKKADED